MRRPNRARTPLLGLLAALAVLAPGCGAGSERPPNVVLLVLDTVRADHLSCYGYSRPTTPVIDALAAAGDRYERVESTAPWTLPSHTSMFTGRFPFQHGVHSGRLADGRVFDGRKLDEENVTLAEALSDAGYRTAAFVANDAYLTKRFGIHQGFGIWEIDRQRAPIMTDKLLAWIDAGPGDQPFFGFVNYLDAHRPYNVDPLPAERAGSLPPPAAEGTNELLRELYDGVMGRGEAPDPALVEKIVSQYDNGVAWLDVAVGQVIAGLRERGLYENTLLIVTSDHGEYFGEHELVEHSKDLYQEAMAIPLVVKRPRQRSGRVISERATLADLPGMVFAELPAPLRKAHGAAFPVAGPRRPVLGEIHFTRPKDIGKPWGHRFLRERAALYVGRFKLILSTDGDDELFDLQADPGELVNLIEREPEVAKRLRARLQSILATGPAPNTLGEIPTLTEEELEDLRELGYL